MMDKAIKLLHERRKALLFSNELLTDQVQIFEEKVEQNHKIMSENIDEIKEIDCALSALEKKET